MSRNEDKQRATEKIAGKITPNDTVDMGSEPIGASKLYEKVDIDFELRRLMLSPTDLDAIYSDLKLIGLGGVGVVKLGKDPILGREVAIKILHPELSEKKQLVERLIREARTTAQIEHPSIAPVHQIGYSKRDGFYFTMKFVRGESLRDIIRRLREGNPEYLAKYSLVRLLNVFLKAGHGVAFAHSRGVVHRDLKPENILVADYGEVIVLDWGLARCLGAENTPGTDTLDEAIRTPLKGSADGRLTVEGLVSGTPAYMSPEQAMGQNSEIDARSDVFSLGSILYEILTLHSPFPQDDPQEVLRAVSRGTFLPPSKVGGDRKVPGELESICMTAMRHNPDERYQTVQPMIDDIYAFLERRTISVHNDRLPMRLWKWMARHPVYASMAATVVLGTILLCISMNAVRQTQYRNLLREARMSIVLGEEHLEQADETYARLELLRRTEFSRSGAPGEAALDQALEEQKAKADGHFEVATMLINRVPKRYRHEPVREALRRIYLSRVRHCLKIHDYAELSVWVDLLKTAVEQGQLERADITEIRLAQQALKGDGLLTIESSQPGVSVTLYRLEGNEIQDLAGAVSRRFPLQIPVYGMSVHKGTYMIRATAPGGPSVDIPVLIPHGEAVNVSVELPGEVPEGCAFVPGGNCILGGDGSRIYRRHQCEIPAFFMSIREVTFRQYIVFWLSLSTAKERDEYMSRVYLSGDDPNPVTGWDVSGVLNPALSPDCPVVGVTHAGAQAFCDWLSAKTGRSCRLPTAEEWEKAARGVDGRLYPWGDTFRPEYAFILENEAAGKRFGNWAPPGSFPHDRSVYGIMDLGGNVREWTASGFNDGSPYYQIKGASSATPRRFLHCDSAGISPLVPSDVGFRYVIPVTAEHPL